MENILSISEITGQVKDVLEGTFRDVYIIGEISNFTAHVSGHWYFTLKDQGAQISCVMWKGYNGYVFFTPQQGMKVILRGRLTVYPPRGNYQFDTRSMKTAGEGELQVAFEKLKAKLSAEGLFSEEFKKPVPSFPGRIGIVTAIGGAALRDMISVAKRRYPLAELVIAPARVQGEGAAAEIAASIKRLNRLDDIDVIIAGRGGGSLEDLWPFNEEKTARAIFESRIPVISGVGHETDFTIADFCADLRAPTPSAAMELATPDIKELFAFIKEFSYYSTSKMNEILRSKKESVYTCLNSYGFRAPIEKIRNRSQYIDNLFYRFQSAVESYVLKNRHSLEMLAGRLEAHNSDKILKKGFALIRQNGTYIPRAGSLNENESFTIRFYDNELKAKNEKK